LHAGVNNLPTGLRQDVASRLGAATACEPDDVPTSADEVSQNYLHTSALNNLLAAAEATGYANRFTAIRADILWRPALTDGTGLLLNPKPTARGAQTAIVVGLKHVRPMALSRPSTAFKTQGTRFRSLCNHAHRAFSDCRDLRPPISFNNAHRRRNRHKAFMLA
jgi:hypothetical protein